MEDGLALKPFNPERDGRIAMVIAVGRRLKQEFPEADVRIPVAGPFSVAFNLRGITALCEDVADRPAVTAKLLWRLAENQAVLCQRRCRRRAGRRLLRVCRRAADALAPAIP